MRHESEIKNKKINKKTPGGHQFAYQHGAEGCGLVDVEPELPE